MGEKHEQSSFHEWIDHEVQQDGSYVCKLRTIHKVQSDTSVGIQNIIIKYSDIILFI